MIILGLDLATRSGYCYGDGSALPTVGHFDLPRTGDEVGPYLGRFEDWLRPFIVEIGAQLVVIEAPFSRRSDTTHITRKLHALPGVAEMVCWRLGVQVRQETTFKVKKALTGNTKADKALMMACARAYGLTIAVDDEADAFGVWLAALRAHQPKIAPRWDFLFAKRWRDGAAKETA